MESLASLGRLLSPFVALPFLLACSSSDSDSGEEQTLRLTAWATLSGVGDLYNQHVAGKPTGAQDLSGSCAFGGSFRITGQTGPNVSDSPQSIDLVYELTACRVAPVSADGATYADLIVDGVLTEQGSISPTYASVSYASDDLGMTGTVTQQSSTYPVDRRCSVRMNRKTSSVNALVCDTNVAW